MAANLAVVDDGHGRHGLLANGSDFLGTPGMKPAARWRRNIRGYFTFQIPPFPLHIGKWLGGGLDQGPGIRMQRIGKKSFCIRKLYNLSQVHDRQPIAQKTE